LPKGARHALIGPNGAGKTTFIDLLTGRLRPDSGEIVLNNEDITHLAPDKRVKRGIVRTFQINTLLKDMSVLENVQIAELERRGDGGRMIGGARVQLESAEVAYKLLEDIRLADYADSIVKNLSYGQLRLVEIAIALAMRPTIMLLDEPEAGVPPADSQIILEMISELPEDISVLLIEHDMQLVFDFAKQISVLSQGGLLREGTPEQIAGDDMVKEVYLGYRTYA
jgi:branched-chain amino acid transport system ATP-binding protein